MSPNGVHLIPLEIDKRGKNRTESKSSFFVFFILYFVLSEIIEIIYIIALAIVFECYNCRMMNLKYFHHRYYFPDH